MQSLPETQMKRIAVISNINMDPLKNHLQQVIPYELWFAGYNQWQAELLNPGSELSSFNPDFLYLHLDTMEFKGELTEVLAAAELFLERNPAMYLIISDFSDPPFSVMTYLPGQDRAGWFNEALKSFAADHDNVFILEFDRLVRLHGYTTLFDEKYWYLGRIRHSARGFAVLAQELGYVAACLEGKARKVLILDLDDTLWGGIVGEEGWQNLRLSHDGPGLAYLEFQKEILALKRTGVLLAISSKNNEADVREVFEKNQEMQLSWDDFVAREIHWDQKPAAVARIAEHLGLGLDALVFLDDSPAEREMVRQLLPEVAVPEFPRDVALRNRWFVTDVVYPYFSKRRLTREDLEKTDQYRRKADREKIRKTLDYREFLEQLSIRLTILPAAEAVLPRMAQLTQKTNQFNLTVRRYTEADLRIFLQDPSHLMFTLSYEDKFGGEGLTGFAMAVTERDCARIDTFLLSCRVLGRNVEQAFLKHILEALRHQKVRVVEAEFVPAPRNGLAKEFYSQNGFTDAGNGRFTLHLE
jgi:FkbH-like protein